jgi:hypothetical protein
MGIVRGCILGFVPTVYNVSLSLSFLGYAVDTPHLAPVLKCPPYS